MEKTKKKGKNKKKKREKNIVAGKHCYNQQCHVWGATMFFPHHLQSNIVYKKIGSGINRGVLKLTRRPQLSKTIWSGDKEKKCISEQKKYKKKKLKKNNKLVRGLVVVPAS